MMLQIKFGCNRPTGCGDIHVERVDGWTDVPTFIFFLSILHVKKYPIMHKVPNNTLDFYGLNRIFNVCSFP